MITSNQKTLIDTLVNQRVQLIADSYERDVAHLAATVNRELKANRRLVEENRSLKADLLNRRSLNENERLNATGIGVITPTVRLSQQESAALLPAKLAVTPLRDVLLYDAVSRGINPKNKAEFDAFLGVEGE